MKILSLFILISVTQIYFNLQTFKLQYNADSTRTHNTLEHSSLKLILNDKTFKLFINFNGLKDVLVRAGKKITVKLSRFATHPEPSLEQEYTIENNFNN